MPQVQKEIFTSEVIKKFEATPTFLDTIPSKDSMVGNGVIHLTDLGADPEVLIDNEVYSIVTVASDDNDVIIVLRKLDTTNTPITDDELYAITYNKMGETTNKHSRALRRKAAALALYSLAPASHSAQTPVLATTGADDGTGRLKLTPDDLSKHQLHYNNLEVDEEDRHIVLCPEHVNDLNTTSQVFKDQYANLESGKPVKLFGWNIHMYPKTVYYNSSNTKLSFGALPTGTDKMASVTYYAPNTVKAMGFNGKGMKDMKMYYRESEKDPENRQSVMGFRTYFVCVPKVARAIGAIVS